MDKRDNVTKTPSKAALTKAALRVLARGAVVFGSLGLGALVFGSLILFLSGCSQHTRTADVEFDPQQILESLDQHISEFSESGSNGDIADLSELREAEGVRIYYATSHGERGPGLGPVESVFSFADFSFIGESFDFSAVTEGEAYFLDLPTESGHENVILFVLTIDGETRRYVLSNLNGGERGQLSDTDFITVLEGAGGTVGVQTFDVSGGDIDGVIQLRFFIDQDGENVQIGKISSLVGFQ